MRFSELLQPLRRGGNCSGTTSTPDRAISYPLTRTIRLPSKLKSQGRKALIDF